MARFACLACDSSWLEDLIIGATDAIEETFFVRLPSDTFFFWLMFLIRVDQKIFHASYFGCTTQPCGCISCAVMTQSMRPANCLDHSFSLKRSLTLSSVRTFSFTILSDWDFFELTAVFVIRYVEKKIDRLLNPAILDYSPVPSEFEGIQFESEWSFLRSLTPKKRPAPTQAVTHSAKNGTIGSPSHRGFASLGHNFSRNHGGSSSVSLHSMFNDAQPPDSPSPISITSIFDALQTFLILSGTNPAFITQVWSQVFYWFACEPSSVFPITSLILLYR